MDENLKREKREREIKGKEKEKDEKKYLRKGGSRRPRERVVLERVCLRIEHDSNDFGGRVKYVGRTTPFNTLITRRYVMFAAPFQSRGEVTPHVTQ